MIFGKTNVGGGGGGDLRLPFRVGLMALVVFNVLFVQLTDAVGGPWLALLYGTTLAYPLWWRLANSPIWRLVWNCAVLALFLQLLWRASTTGVRHLLESGMLLAVFCQVHLLNVLQRSQNADLVFFNSFLIALVTSFFVQDVVYSLVFVGYAFTFVLTLHMNAVAFGDHEIERGALRVVGPQAVRRGLTVVAVTALLFLVLPRDFRREGLVGDDFAWSQQRISGYTEEIQLGRSGNTTVSDRIVMRLRPVGDTRIADVPTHWRGSTSVIFEREAWSRLNPVFARDSADPVWRAEDAVGDVPTASRTHTLAADEAVERATIEVRHFGSRVERVFLPLDAVGVRIGPTEHPVHASYGLDGTCQYPVIRSRRTPDEQETLVWWVETVDDLPPRRGRLSRRLHTVHTSVSPSDIPAAAIDVLRELRLPRTATVRDKARAVQQWLYANRVYLLPGQQGAATDLADFFEGARGGHCEYFATALALMLRMQGVACRVVGGYLAAELDESGEEIIVRDKHAHAWVEVWEDGQGWFTVDATPAVEMAREGRAADEGDDWFAGTIAWLDDLWRSVTQFDAERRAAVFARILDAPRQSFLALSRRPGTALGLAFVLGCALYALHRRRQRRSDDLTRARQAWRRAVRRARIRPHRHETPREVVARARRTVDRPDRIDALAAAAAEHERVCYAVSH